MSEKRKSYWEKLKDPRWQKKRLELFENAGWKCGVCTEKTRTLHVHHKVYLKGVEPWDYEPWAYDVLCDECHVLAQEQMSVAHIAIAKEPGLIGLCEAILQTPNPGSVTQYLEMAVRDICPDYLVTLIDSALMIRASGFNAGHLEGRAYMEKDKM